MKEILNVLKKATACFVVCLGLISFFYGQEVYADAAAVTCLDKNSQPVSVGAKNIQIINNTPNPIYAIIETSTPFYDEWLQACFRATSNSQPYGTSKGNNYRVYIPNIPAKPATPDGSNIVEVSVPFFSPLNTNPTSGMDQYIDWFNGGRVHIYDNQQAFLAAYNIDSAANPVNLPPSIPPWNGPQCISTTSCGPVDGSGNLLVYKAALHHGLPHNDPNQLTEYTFTDISRHVPVYFPYDFTSPDNVDYDVSYVDHVYLPIAMEPISNTAIGYTGSTMAVGTVQPASGFRGIVSNFIKNTGWGVFTGSYLTAATPKVPGAYNLLVAATEKQTDITPNTAQQTLRNNWTNCRSSDPNCQVVNNFYSMNLANYTNNLKCPVPITPDSGTFLDHIYGFVPFECPGKANSLASTPGGDFPTAEKIYKILQYYNAPPNAFTFNPYVNFIHGPSYLNMKGAYAFSIDDIVGNMHEEGDGIVIAVGGGDGLPNENEFDPTKLIRVNLGDPGGKWQWVSYQVCTNNANPLPLTYFKSGQFSFQISSDQIATMIGGNGCQVTVTDNNNKNYTFLIKRLAPWTPWDTRVQPNPPSPDAVPLDPQKLTDSINNYYIGCNSPDDWCDHHAVNVSIADLGPSLLQKSFINTPPPNSSTVPGGIVAPIITAVRDPNTSTTVNLTYTNATGGHLSTFNYTYTIVWANGTILPNWPVSSSPVAITNFGLGSGTITVTAQDVGGTPATNPTYGNTATSNAVTIPAIISPPVIPANGAYWLAPRFPNTIALTFTPPAGGSGGYTFTYNVNGSPWNDVTVANQNQVLLNRLNNAVPNSISVTATDSQGDVTTSNVVTVPPLRR